MSNIIDQVLEMEFLINGERDKKRRSCFEGTLCMEWLQYHLEVCDIW